MAPYRPVLLLVGLCILIAPEIAAAQAKQDEPRVIARWHGTIEEKSAAGFRPAAGDLFGYLISPPGSAYEMKASVIFREEISAKGEVQTVMESLAWSASVKDLHYLSRDDGGRFAAGKGGQGSKSYSEEELVGPLIAPDPQELEAARKRVEQAQAAKAAADKSFSAAKGKRDQAEKARNGAKADQNMEGRKKAMDAAQANYEAVFNNDKSTTQQKRDATAELTRARNEYYDSLAASADPKSGLPALEYALVQAESRMADAKRTLDQAIHNLEDAQANFNRLQRGHRRPLATATVVYQGDRKSGNVHVAFNFAPLEQIAYDQIPMQQIEGEGAGRTVLARIGKRLAVVLSNNSDIKHHHVRIPPIPSGNAIGAVTGETATASYDYNKAGTQIKIRYERRGVPDKSNTLLVKGQVFHRVRVPQSLKDANVIRPNVVGKQEGMLAVQGKVRVEAWLADANTPPPVAGAAPSGQFLGIANSAPGGEFSLRIPEPASSKTLRLRLKYESMAAQLVEINTVDVSSDDVRAAMRSGDQNRTLTSVRRHGECQVRYERLPNGKLIDLGHETRDAVVRKSGADYSLEFNGNNAILINTLCLKAPYIAQEYNPFKINVVVPNQRLLKAIPDWWSKEQQATVKNRLPGNGKNAEARMDLETLGAIVCYPTCITMALGCLNEITVDGVPCDKTREIAQGIYEHYYESHKAAAYRQFPFQFPFFDDASTAINLWAGPGGRLFAFPEELRRPIIEKRLTRWPFVPANQSYDGNNIRWMCTVPDGAGLRPWQYAEHTKKYLEQPRPNGYDMKITDAEEVDLFHGARDQQVINALGRGCPATASIKHLDGDGIKKLNPDNSLVQSVTPGGHILCLLGAVIDNQGAIKRLIFHDPYGDQTQTPTQPGYYDPSGKRVRDDVDRHVSGKQPKNIGAYVPYGPDIISFIEFYDEKGRLVDAGIKAGKLTQVAGINTKWWVVFTCAAEKDIAPAQWQSALPPRVQARLLPGGQ